jgi:hypothetical protein
LRLALALIFAGRLVAHDAPAQVTVHVQLRPAGQTMHALVRIPLEAVRDVDFPATPAGYLDMERLAPLLPGLAKTWVADSLVLSCDGALCGPPASTATQISIESDRSFASFDSAAARLRARLPSTGENLFWKQVFFDVALEFPIPSEAAAFAIRPAYAGLGERVTTLVHFRDRVLVLPGDTDAVPLEPSRLQAAWAFTKMGFVHILEGVDHLLFLVCLVLATRQLRSLIWTVTAFTAAHSITLIAAALGVAPEGLWFPPAVELAIAVSIVYMALANVFFGSSGNGSHSAPPLAFAFGLVHGFGFSFALRESMQFAGGHLLTGLLSFNAGVEAGQLAALAVMAPIANWGLRRLPDERLGIIVLSTLVAHTGWHWMEERWDVLSRYPRPVLEWSAANGALALKAAAAALVLWAVWRWWTMRQ